MDLGSHLLNLLVWYLGAPERLVAITRQWFSEQVEDQLHAWMWFGDGLAAWIDVCWSVPNYRLPVLKIHLIGDNGEATITNDELRVFLKKSKSGLSDGWTRQSAVDLRPELEFELAEEYYTLQLRDTIDYCQGKTSHLNEITTEEPTQALIEAVYESAKTNTVVRI